MNKEKNNLYKEIERNNIICTRLNKNDNLIQDLSNLYKINIKEVFRSADNYIICLKRY